MSGLLLASSPLAKHPFKVLETGLLIYSAEELCYYIYNNYYLVDDDFVDDDLLDFLRDELGLSQVADRVATVREEGAGTHLVLACLMREVHYYPEASIKEFLQKYESYRHNSPSNRKIIRADFLMEKGHFLAALRIYHQFDSGRRDPSLGNEFFMRVRQHMAVAYIKLGLYREAMEAFEAAYSYKDSPELLKQIWQFSNFSGVDMSPEIKGIVTEEDEAQWRNDYDEVSAQGSLLATTGYTASMFKKDSVRRKEAVNRYIEMSKKNYRAAIV